MKKVCYFYRLLLYFFKSFHAKGPVIKYLLGGVEDIFWGYEKNNRTSRGYQNLNTIGTEKYIL
jgi:hypothetical protein